MLSRRPLFARTFPAHALVLAGAFSLLGCDGSDDDERGGDQQPAVGAPSVTIVATSPESICNLGAGPFSAVIDNPWFPLPAGQVAELRGEEDGEQDYLRMTVETETEDVAGVATRVLEEHEEVGGEIS